MFVDVLCRFLGKPTVSPPVVRGWWNDSAWLFSFTLQECVRCHFGSAKQCWIICPNRWRSYERDLRERMRKQPLAEGESTHEMLPLSPPSPWHSVLHLCWAPVELVPPGQPRTGGMSFPLSGDEQDAAPSLEVRTAAGGQSPAGCKALPLGSAAAAALLPPSCHPPARLQLPPATADLCLTLLGSSCAGDRHTWRKILFVPGCHESWALAPKTEQGKGLVNPQAWQMRG